MGIGPAKRSKINVVAEMAGTYDQTKTTDTTGKLVFKPITSKTSAEHGAAQVEEDETIP